MSGISTHWNGTELSFETAHMRGRIVADGRRFQIADLVWLASGLMIDRGMALAPYRLLARSAWLGEARAMPHTAEPVDNGLRVTFEPTRAHQARLVFTLTISGDATIDCAVDVASYAAYADYELMMSAYFAEGFKPGAYIGPGVRGPVAGIEQVRPVATPFLRDLYLAFPRDERAANIVTDGRWQRGRHLTRFAPVRYYALPFGFYSHEPTGLDILLMSRAEDVFAVSMAYHSDDPSDDVGQHRSLYLSLFGRDLDPGQRFQTDVRLQLGEWAGDAAAHQNQFARFLNDRLAAPYLDIGDQIEQFLR